VKIRILESARQDLVDGYYFYEKQADGIGTYFLQSIVSDIDCLIDHAPLAGRFMLWIRPVDAT